jgi:AcrR family transcriptional regulator
LLENAAMTATQATRTMPTGLAARKRPRHPRAQATVEAIVEAAARILDGNPAVEFTTNHVAELAGVGIGSLYQYFPNKSALVAALLEREHRALADALEVLVAALDGTTLDASLAALARFAVTQQFDRPRLAAVLDVAERRLPVETMLADTESRLVDAVEHLLAQHRHALPDDLPAGAARDCLAIAKALVESEIATGRGAPPDLAARVFRALNGYLTVLSPDR